MLFFQPSTCIENLVRAGVFLLNCVTPTAESFEAGVRSLKNGAENLTAMIQLNNTNGTLPEGDHRHGVNSNLEIALGVTVGLLCVTGVVLACRSIRKSRELRFDSQQDNQYAALKMQPL